MTRPELDAWRQAHGYTPIEDRRWRRVFRPRVMMRQIALPFEAQETTR